MPIKGRNKKAKIRDVVSAYREAVGKDSPRFKTPIVSKGFGYFQRANIVAMEDPLFCMLTVAGASEELNQQEYLQVLEDVAEELRRVRFILSEKWKE